MIYSIVNRESGKSLSASAKDGEGSSLSQQAAEDAPSLHSNIRPVGNGTFPILNCGNGLAITAPASPTSGSFVQATYYGQDVQKWEIVPVATPV